jgi:branched-chain amino acid transport system substrate-binding protein
MSRRLMIAVATAAAIALGTAACSSSSTSSTSSTSTSAAGTGTSAAPFKMTAILATSGDIGTVGAAMEQGMRAAVAVVNANGGVFGRPMQLNVLDDASSPTQAATVAQSLISSGSKPDAVSPGTISAETQAIVPILAKAGIFMSTHASDPTLDDPAKYPSLFGDGQLPADEADNLADEFASAGYKKIGILTSNDVSGQNFFLADKQAFAAKGISAQVAYVPSGATDATSQLEQLIAGKPSALLLSAYGATAGPIIKARAELNPNLPTYGSQLFTANNLAQLAPASSYTGIKFQALDVGVQGAPVTKSTAFTTFLAALQKVVGGNLPFTMNTYACAYNDVIIAATAANLAKSVDPAAMSKAVESATPAQMPLLVAPVTFSTTEHWVRFDQAHWMYVPFGPTVDGLLVPGKAS